MCLKNKQKRAQCGESHTGVILLTINLTPPKVTVKELSINTSPKKTKKPATTTNKQPSFFPSLSTDCLLGATACSACFKAFFAGPNHYSGGERESAGCYSRAEETYQDSDGCLHRPGVVLGLA